MNGSSKRGPAPLVALLVITLRQGGIERQYVRLANELVRQGLQVDLVAYEAQGEFRSLLDPKVNLVGLNGSHATWKNLFPLISYLKQRKPEAILGGHDLANAVMVLARSLAMVKTRTMVLAHTTLSIRYSQTASFRKKMQGAFIRFLFRKADVIAAVSQGSATDLAHFLALPQEKVHPVYIGTIDDEFWNSAQKQPSHPFLLKPDLPVVISVGRLSPEKNFELLIKAFKLALDQKPMRLIIFGEGPERSALEKLINSLKLKDCVALPGFTANPAAELKHASAFVLSSNREGLPTALVEALAIGVPIVATDCPSGPSEILEDGKWGQLVPMNDDKALAAAIQIAVGQPQLSRPEAYQRFTVTDCATKIRSMLLKGVES